MARTYGEYLRAVPLFADLGDDELDVIGGAVTDLQLPAGKVVMREGALAHELIVVVDGNLEVTRDGRHVADIGPGGIAGEMALLTDARRHATVTATTDVRALHIDGRQFMHVLEQAPQIAIKLLPIVAQRVIDNSDHPSH